MLSESVSKAFHLTGGEEASETAHFVGMMDKFFDCLNVHNYVHGIHKRKFFQMPYTSAADSRLKVCIIIICMYKNALTLQVIVHWDHINFYAVVRAGFPWVSGNMGVISGETFWVYQS